MRISQLGIALLVSASLSAPAALAAGDAPKDKGKLVCKSERKTGTRFPKRTCYRKADWEKITEANRRAAEELLNSRVVSTAKGN